MNENDVEEDIEDIKRRLDDVESRCGDLENLVGDIDDLRISRGSLRKAQYDRIRSKKSADSVIYH